MLRSFFILCALCVVCRVKSAIIIVDQVEISGHENQCYDKDGKVFYNKGDIMKNDGEECTQTKCLGFWPESGKLRVEILTCPKVEAGSGCTIIQDPSKPYPECCPQIVSMPSIDPKYCVPKNPEKE